MNDAEPPRLPRRNVEVYNSFGVVVAGFWQYGTLTWDEFYRYMLEFIYSVERWLVFQYDFDQQQYGAPCPQGPEVVQPGRYIILSPDGAPVSFGVVEHLIRPRSPVHSSTPARDHYYRDRARARDGKCLITGLRTQTYSRLEVAHIFPRAHDTEWVRRGYPSKIMDPADPYQMGGPMKIDSVQNLITLRSDLHKAWDNYEYGVDPNNNYRITAFTNGNEDINGRHLQLDHIQAPNLRPLDELLTDHFKQGIYKHMRGAAEPEWTLKDADDVFGDGSFDMSNPMIWGTREGKERFELTLVDRLFDHCLMQQSQAAGSNKTLCV